MEQQALRIADWGANVYVKIPITNTRRQSSAPLVDRLARQGVKVNVTAMMTLAQVDAVIPQLAGWPAELYLDLRGARRRRRMSIRFPSHVRALERMRPHPQIELIWASPRELFNIVQADTIGCHIITVTHDLLEEAAHAGQGPGRVLARHRQDVLRRRPRRPILFALRRRSAAAAGLGTRDWGARG